MLMIRENFPDGGFRLRHITRACLPEGPVPKDGRILTVEQVNDAMSLANHAMSRRREIGKAEYDVGREALHHILGHIIAEDRDVKAERAAHARALVAAHKDTDRLVGVVRGMIEQDIYLNADGLRDSMFITAHAEALRELCDRGVMVAEMDDGGRYVRASFVAEVSDGS